MLYDKARIYVQSGKGGNGCASLRREKYVPYGGPDGGNGGEGGSVYLVVDPHLNTLIPFKHQRHFRAENGQPGQGNNRQGRRGADLEIAVPPGTVVHPVDDEEAIPTDLVAPGQRLLVAQGGRGGRGNAAFATPSRQTPRWAELGEPGESRWLGLELKLIADLGLVGFPNAGKSTLLASISAARPKIAAYPFTTLSPNLGVVTVGDYGFIVADIPGLIEGASRGAGLGLEFLRHVERTRLLVHVLDGAGVDGRDPLDDYAATNHELAHYSAALAERHQLVAINKMDLPDARARWEQLCRELPVAPADLFAISAATGEGVQALINRAAAILQQLPPAHDLTPRDEILIFRPPPSDEDRFTIERDAEGFRLRGVRIERVAAMTNFDNEEAVERFQRILTASGIEAALQEAGVRPGDLVQIGSVELYWEAETDWEEREEDPYGFDE